MRFLVLGNPDSPRVDGFNAALQRKGLPPPVVIPWADWLRGRVALPNIVCAGDIVRLESPGRDWDVEKLLLKRGAAEAQSEGQFDSLPAETLEHVEFEKGRLWLSRQWFLGFADALREIENQLSVCPPHHATHSSAEIAVMFDKPLCHDRLQSAGIPVPRTLGVPQSFDDLAARMHSAHCYRVFVKLAHGSSAAGVVAYETNGRRHRAITTTEVVRESGETRLYNSRRVRVLQSHQEIALVIDALCRQRVHVEEWIPKANFQGKSCDLRVLIVAGRARHMVARLSRHPLTNLHLLNDRTDGEVLRKNVPHEHWEVAMHSCEKAMTCFPKSLTGGVDILFTPGFRRHAILEINAWGDLLHGALHEGEDAYGAQVSAALADQLTC